MKILIIRHADPDYSVDSLTDVGRVEAELLSQKLSKMDISDFYVSIYGRARDTARYTLEKMNCTATEYEWLKEFSPKSGDGKKNVVFWDMLPREWTKKEIYYTKNWYDDEEMQGSGIKEEYLRVTGELDKLIARHGYVREGNLYRAQRPNEDTIALFCHFGIECIFLGHLLGISPILLLHGFCAAPSSVTTLVTEEREKGIAYFRAGTFGDTSHLYAGGREPSFAARFCEMYDNFDQRH